MGAHAHPASSEKDNMKGIQILFISCLAAAAFGEEAAGESSSSNTRAGGGSSGGGAAGNTRLFGGLGAGLLGGLAQGLTGGFNQGGFNPGIGGIRPPPRPASCRYWCRTPQGQAYCCEDGARPPSVVTVKPGRCPPVRPTCPPVRNFGGPPQTCSNDGSCAGYDKCCFDTCLQEHVCKPPHNPNPFGGGFGGGFQGGFGR